MGGRSLLVAASIASLITLSGCRKKHVSRQFPPPPNSSPRQTPAPIQSTETGTASWYGHPYHGRPAADGEIYDMEGMVAAHRTLPFNTWVRVTNLKNGKQVEVRIIDRGPFVDGRIIDLSHAAAQMIDMIGTGIAPVRVDVISTPPPRPSRAVGLFAVQVGAFRDRSKAEELKAKLDRNYSGPTKIILRGGDVALWRVLIGRTASADEANRLAQRLRAEVGPAFVVRLDDSSMAAAQVTPAPHSAADSTENSVAPLH